MTYVTGRQWHDEAFLLQKVFVLTLTCPIISHEVSAILADLIVTQLRDIPYIKKNLGNSNSEGIAENRIELIELTE